MNAAQPQNKIRSERRERQREFRSAIVRGDAQKVRQLLDAGADPNGHPDADHGEEPIRAAVRLGNLQMVDLLLQLRVNTSGVDELGLALLHTAYSFGHTEIANRLLVEGLSATAPDRYGCTPMHHAIAGTLITFRRAAQPEHTRQLRRRS